MATSVARKCEYALSRAARPSLALNESSGINFTIADANDCGSSPLTTIPFSPSEISSQKPGSMTLKIERESVTKEFTFQLAETAQLLRDNQLQLLQGELVPLGPPERYLYCFK